LSLVVIASFHTELMASHLVAFIRWTPITFPRRVKVAPGLPIGQHTIGRGRPD